MDRRTFLRGLVATAAGVLVPGQVLAEPKRRVWALDRTMVTPKMFGGMTLVDVRTGQEIFIPIEDDGTGYGVGVFYIPPGTWTGKDVQWSVPFSDPGQYHLRGVSAA